MFDCGLESCKQTNHMLAIAHFRVAFSPFLKPRPSAKPFIWIKLKENSFPYEWFCTWPQFEKEAKSNSETIMLLITILTSVFYLNVFKSISVVIVKQI